MRDFQCRPLRAARGFTLIEVLAVLVILAVAAAVALPALTDSTSAELRAAAQTVAAGLRQTRDQAIMGNREAVMVVDVEEKRIGLDARSRQLPRWAGIGLFTARRERIDANRGAIRFFPDGSSTGGRVTLAGDDESLLVDVDWLTGGVSILEGGPEDWEAPTPFDPVRIE